MELVWKYRRRILWILFLLFCSLAVIFLFKKEIITEQVIKQKKDFFDSILKLTTIITLFFGAFLSYFKFFKGRIFNERLVIDLNANVIQDVNRNLHVIDVEIKNIGNSAIWYPKEAIKAIGIRDGGDNDLISLPNSPDELLDETKNEFLIEPQENSSRHYTNFVAKEILAVTYKISVSSKKGNTWSKVITVSNMFLEK